MSTTMYCLLYFSKSSFKVDLCAPIAYYFKVETVATALDIPLSVPMGNQRVRFPQMILQFLFLCSACFFCCNVVKHEL